MPAKDSREADRAAELSALQSLLGSADGVTPRVVTLDSLSKLTLKQLLEGAKRLGLTAVSKMKKEALTQAVLDAWHALHGDADGAGNGHHAAGRDDDEDGQGQGNGAGAPQLQDLHGLPAAVAVGPAVVLADGTPAVDDRGGDVAVTSPLSHKFEVGQAGQASLEAARDLLRESAKEIPWGYGRDRLAAMTVDPDRLFAYWEVLDGSIEAARAKLGPGGPGAWLNLRVYDTTGRIFDGTNAHAFFDHTVERGDRQWFFGIGRPTSEAIIEIGMKSHEGYFVKIARSGRVEFPRREPAAPSEPEWLTVRVATGQVEHAGGRGAARSTRAPGAGAAPAGVGLPPLPGVPATFAGTFDNQTLPAGGALRRSRWQDATQMPGGGHVERQEWEEVYSTGPLEELRRFRWDGPATITSWQSGPFTYPVEIPEPVREAYVGKTRVLKVGGHTHVLYGPWQVIIRGLGAQQARVVLSRWEVYRTWAAETGHQREEVVTTISRTGSGASERMMGASERRWVGGSELRLGGGSEIFFLKASELRLGGASERLYAGASQWVMRGASERLFAGASEALRKGASEQLYGRGFLGGSEGRLAGGPATSGGGRGDDMTEARASEIYPQPPSAQDGGGQGESEGAASTQSSRERSR